MVDKDEGPLVHTEHGGKRPQSSKGLHLSQLRSSVANTRRTAQAQHTSGSFRHKAGYFLHGATFPALRKKQIRYTLSSMQSEELENLYPELTEEERSEAAENLDRYLTLAWEIYEESGEIQSFDAGRF
jgi:hypothetical protein